MGAKAAGPLIRSVVSQYGPQVLEWLYSKAKNYVNFKSHGSGQGLVNYPISSQSMGGNPMSMMKSSYATAFGLNKVSLEYLASVLCPEKYTTLTPDFFGTNLCSTTKTSQFSLITGTDGNCFDIVLPDMATVGAVVNTSFQQFMSNAGSIINPQTGVTSAGSFLPGIFNTAGVGTIQRYRVTSSAIRVVPQLAAVNNSGEIVLAYSTDVSNTTVLTNPVISQNEILQYPFLHIATVNGTKEWRQIHLPHDVTELALDDFSVTPTGMYANGGLDLCIIQGTGLPVSSVIGQIFFTQGIDFMPGASGIGVLKPKATPDAQGSIPCAASLIKRIPHLTQLSAEEAADLADQIVNIDSNDFGTVIETILQMCHVFKPRPKVSLGSGGQTFPGGIGEVSFDLAM
jgi:hypothetical protein